MKLINADCREALKELPDNSVDSCVCDPPYEINMLARVWDRSGIAYDQNVWKEVLRVLKPGGYLLAFSATRTHHRMVCAIEDAGFEIREEINWIHPQSFPKSLNISKEIDRYFGAEREVIGTYKAATQTNNCGTSFNSSKANEKGQTFAKITKPATAEAREWDGWGSNLKVVTEPICCARKPLEGTVVENVLKYGTGGINIDACRIGDQKRINAPRAHESESVAMGGGWNEDAEPTSCVGRWPSNIILSHSEECRLIGKKKINGRVLNQWTDGSKPFGGGAGHEYESEEFPEEEIEVYECVEGCPIKIMNRQSENSSRFFLTAKADSWDRNEGVVSERKSAGECTNREEDTAGINNPRAGAGRTGGHRNHHVSVKPTDLMRYLVRLVTRRGGVVLDPFMGSGTTGIACKHEKMDFIGIELSPEYFAIAEERIKNRMAQQGLF